jgi:hypothetical protein
VRVYIRKATEKRDVLILEGFESGDFKCLAATHAELLFHHVIVDDFLFGKPRGEQLRVGAGKIEPWHAPIGYPLDDIASFQ